MKPLAWITDESLLRLARGGNDSRGSVPVHAQQSSVAKTPLFRVHPEVLGTLHEVETYLAEREDVIDGDYGQPAPNAEMVLLQEVRAAIAKATAA